MALWEKVKNLPESPGVYLYKDETGEVIYVGKAKNLKNRVRSYFQPREKLLPKTRVMMEKARDIEVIITSSEVEALILEQNLIKRYRPRYNILLKDDKSYPYLKITGEEFPRLLITRKVINDGGSYFGPYPDAGALNETYRLLRSIFKFRTCTPAIFAQKKRPCLNFHIKKCSAPCAGEISREEYFKEIEMVRDFLEGRGENLIKKLKKEMAIASDNLEFERAAKLRDQILALEKILAKQKISRGERNADVVAVATGGDLGVGLIFVIRQGNLLGQKVYTFTGEMETGELLNQVLVTHYGEAKEVPVEIILTTRENLDEEFLNSWFELKFGKKPRFTVPKRGEKFELLKMALENVNFTLDEKIKLKEKKQLLNQKVLMDLKEALNLPAVPRRIEGYDISHLAGTGTVASMVVFIDGEPVKGKYRRFAIRRAANDDYTAMFEAVLRRFKKYLALQVEGGADGSFEELPDLVLIDGGKGQLNAAMDALKETNLLGKFTVIALAKEQEEIFLPGKKDSLLLTQDREGLKLLQRVRDEAHRFAKGYQEKKRVKTLASLLEQVEGIGPKRRKQLLNKFGSIKNLREATVEEIIAVPGITREIAERLKELLEME
ncbi:excinuclease ABC subunit C [Carboxydothermus islandicus]|uniref:UvrABC system protein C n=1 Tax=Carboxydothermus islandicus TaxID=661089 RepID=A0A1L8D0L7_9THEO|nr:excinuclease ABC subunit UvrC [Carboxydothermus islandicus]GAV24736.1 excinuclease ABC subunit C [Carboxydothermus islandicus]